MQGVIGEERSIQRAGAAGAQLRRECSIELTVSRALEHAAGHAVQRTDVARSSHHSSLRT